ncbi:hypothetical protein BDV93DRAFT_245900 [Ceratobasidium sp. AG-I]|nr:hypothetical protein BDV93DRAFT_245900 [Ceratobasidium sp. AG-I]
MYILSSMTIKTNNHDSILYVCARPDALGRLWSGHVGCVSLLAVSPTTSHLSSRSAPNWDLTSWIYRGWRDVSRTGRPEVTTPFGSLPNYLGQRTSIMQLSRGAQHHGPRAFVRAAAALMLSHPDALGWPALARLCMRRIFVGMFYLALLSYVPQAAEILLGPRYETALSPAPVVSAVTLGLLV